MREEGQSAPGAQEKIDPGAAKEFGGLDPPNFACTGQRSKPMILNPVVRETFSHPRGFHNFHAPNELRSLLEGQIVTTATANFLRKGEPAMKARIDYTNVPAALRGMY